MTPGFSDETDIFIWRALKEKVWNFEYVDLALFLIQKFVDNINDQPLNLKILNGKFVARKKLNKIKNVDNISTWSDAFINYGQVLIENHPQKARELFKYMTVIRNIAQHNPISDTIW